MLVAARAGANDMDNSLQARKEALEQQLAELSLHGEQNNDERAALLLDLAELVGNMVL